MVISIHLPPPVMIDSAADLALVTHMLCCSWAMCFSAAASSENDQGSMNLASNTASVSLTKPSSVAAIQRFTGCRTQRWTSVTTRPVLRSYQAPVERLGGDAELDDEIVAQVLGFDFAALFPPQADQRRLVGAHNDPGVRAADEQPAVRFYRMRSGKEIIQGEFHMNSSFGNQQQV